MPPSCTRSGERVEESRRSTRARPPSGRRAACLVVTWALVSCGREPPSPARGRAAHEAPARATDGSIEAITAIVLEGQPALFATSSDALRGVAASLRGAIDAASPRWAALSPAEAIVWQNDLLGLAARARAAPVSDPALAALAESAEAAARSLAPRADAGAPYACEGAPPLVTALLPADQGWREQGTEMPVLSHERAFGLRRVFRVFVRGDLRALASQLVVLDREGHAHTSCVAGEIELLEVGPEGAVSARVWELDRGALAGGPEHALAEIDRVAHVPGLGADRFFLEERTAIPLAELPCRRCHDDAVEMSLPRADLPTGPRIAALLAQLRAPWTTAAPVPSR